VERKTTASSHANSCLGDSSRIARQVLVHLAMIVYGIDGSLNFNPTLLWKEK